MEKTKGEHFKLVANGIGADSADISSGVIRIGGKDAVSLTAKENSWSLYTHKQLFG